MQVLQNLPIFLLTCATFPNRARSASLHVGRTASSTPVSTALASPRLLARSGSLVRPQSCRCSRLIRLADAVPDTSLPRRSDCLHRGIQHRQPCQAPARVRFLSLLPTHTTRRSLTLTPYAASLPTSDSSPSSSSRRTRPSRAFRSSSRSSKAPIRLTSLAAVPHFASRTLPHVFLP